MELEMGFLKRLKTSKTLWVTLGGLLTALGAYLNSEIELSQMIKIAFEAAAIIFIRDGIAKKG